MGEEIAKLGLPTSHSLWSHLFMGCTERTLCCTGTGTAEVLLVELHSAGLVDCPVLSVKLLSVSTSMQNTRGWWANRYFSCPLLGSSLLTTCWLCCLKSVHGNCIFYYDYMI